MKKLFLLVFTLFTTSVALQAQIDAIPAKKGNIILEPITHATMVLKWHGKTIFVDPYGGADKLKAFPAPDLVLITDIHGDHMNLETLKGLDLSKSTLIAPQAVADGVKEIRFKKTVVIGNGGSTKWKGIKVEALPMYNLPETDEVGYETYRAGRKPLLAARGGHPALPDRDAGPLPSGTVMVSRAS